MKRREAIGNGNGPGLGLGHGGGRRGAGFTLTELLVVMGIIMILAAAAVPAMSAFRRGQRLDHSARVIQSALNDARRLAITRHARHVVVFYGYEETPGEVDTVRHAIRIYQEPTGVKPGPNIPPNVSKGYWEGGYVGEALILPANVRFAQTSMECRLMQDLPDPKSDFFKRSLRGEKNDALAFRRDGTIEERADVPAIDPQAGRNIYLPDEGCYQVPEGTRADIVVIETDPSGNEVKSKGKSRRAFVDLDLPTGRALNRVFDIGSSFEYIPTAGTSGVGGT